MTVSNEFGQPVGYEVANWTTRPLPPRRVLEGRWTCLEPLEPGRHGQDLYRANSLDVRGAMWTYLPYGPFEDVGAYTTWLSSVAHVDDPVFFAVLDEEGFAVGLCSLMRIDPRAGSIEVGHLAFSPQLQQTTAATEAMALLAALVFDELGYRRYEWKCDALNAPSRRAASRLGFVFEGTFRQATVVKGRNRDTAWYSITDTEWPRLKSAYAQWLSPDNFDDEGRQLIALSKLTQRID